MRILVTGASGFVGSCFVAHLATILVRLLEDGAEGLAHVGPPQALSIAAFALEITRVFGLDPGLIAAPESARDQERLRLRPRALGLGVEGTARRFRFAFPTVAEALGRMRTDEPRSAELPIAGARA